MKKWNVIHVTDIHDPTHPESGLVFKDLPSTSKRPDEFVFEESSHRLHPNYQLMDRQGHWVVLKDLKELSKKTGQSRLMSVVKSKSEIVKLKRSELVKSGHCCSLEKSGSEVWGEVKNGEEEEVSLVKVESSCPVLELEKNKQEVGMEKSKLATPPNLRPNLRQPAPSVPIPGQTSPSMTHQLPVQPQQPSTDLSAPLLRTRKIMVSHRWPGSFWSGPRSRRRWSSRSRSCLRRRSRCLFSPRSRFLLASRSGLLPAPLRSRF